MALDIEQRAVVAEDGERFSLLLAGTPKQPLFRPPVFSIAMRRSAGLAANTLVRDDGALMHLSSNVPNAVVTRAKGVPLLRARASAGIFERRQAHKRKSRQHDPHVN